jgi:hypothetical protein
MDMVSDKGSFRGLPLRLMLAGGVVILAGIPLQMMDGDPGLMDRLGLPGTIFGLMTKVGGPMVFAGLFAAAIRQRRAERSAA